MPLISRVKEHNLFEKNETTANHFANPNSLLRNTVRLRDGEFAVLSFLTDIDEGDRSLYHSIEAYSANNNRFNETHFCTIKNEREKGVRMVDAPCKFCVSKDDKMVYRYKFWAFVYYQFHAEQNQYGDRDGEDYWDEVKMGRRVYFRQEVMKPQLFETSSTGYSNMENEVDKLGTLDGFLFDYNRVRNDDRVSYNLSRSGVDVPDVIEDSAELVSMLPSIEDVAIGKIEEFDFPTIGKSQGVSTSDKDAFDSVAGTV